MKKISFLILSVLLVSCSATKKASSEKQPFVWEGANLYFLLIDRFNNGDTSNDNIIKRDKPTGVLRGFEGGDIRGIIQKLDEGYFTSLGINAIWLSPVVEQIHGSVDEGTGNTYGFHGYWTKDWTAIDPSYGTRADLKELVDKAHAKGIRIVLDAVINHTGPVTDIDPVYPNDWVRTSPKCTYNSYDNFINCTLVENLPDVKTESMQEVDLPPLLVEKWKKEGRYEQEITELNLFFKQTGFPRAPKYYIMKWLADYILDFGIDGYRADTVKHTYENVWADFDKVCQAAFTIYKGKNPSKVLDNNKFFNVGEVYGYYIGNKNIYDFGDKKVDYFANGFHSLINFDFKYDAKKSYEELFNKYSSILNNDLKGKSVMNYVTSHDDGDPFDKKREKALEAGTKLLLTPGISQIYYGDETARSLEIAGSVGDATLRSFMNWSDIENNVKTQEVLEHYKKLGNFRKNHPAVGAGINKSLSENWFKRTFNNDVVLIGVNLGQEKEINAPAEFAEGTKVRDAYTGAESFVNKGKIYFSTKPNIILIEKI
jgi:alpha-amylase